MKKILVMVAVLAAAVIFLIGCRTEPKPNEINTTNCSNNTADLECIILESEYNIPAQQCLERNLSDKVIVLESKYCHVCDAVVPLLREVEQETGSSFIFLDLAEKSDMDRLKTFSIMPKYTPTLVVGCDVYIGLYTKEKYKTIIENFLKQEG